jgi:hypothetical protein
MVNAPQGGALSRLVDDDQSCFLQHPVDQSVAPISTSTMIAPLIVKASKNIIVSSSREYGRILCISNKYFKGTFIDVL